MTFDEEVAKYVKQYAPLYGIKVVSPIVAQAIKESAWGKSELATKANNFFGIKFKKGRCPSALDKPYVKEGSEQLPDGSYASSVMQWFQFDNIEQCVIGYFDFINIERYKNLKGVTDAYEYCKLIKADGYATSLNYADSLYNDYILKYDLKKYDEKETKKMGYTNSPLTNFTQLSPCHSGQRTHAIDTITIHVYVGQVSVERMGTGWAKTSANASANYGIGSDGRIGLFVEEKNRAWTTGGKWTVNGISGAENDQRAVTIECASDTTAPYAINSKVMDSLIKLVADICKRNNILSLRWKGDKSLVGRVTEQNITCHRWFTSKSCPGDYIYNRLGNIANEVNKILGNIEDVPSYTTEIKHTVAKGETLGKIANAYKVTVSELALWNNIQNVNKIYPGQVLTIKTDIRAVPKTYTVVSGDTLSGIGKKTGVKWQTIASINNISFPYIIRKGQVLRLS